MGERIWPVRSRTVKIMYLPKASDNVLRGVREEEQERIFFTQSSVFVAVGYFKI